MTEERKINEVPPSKSGKHVVIDYFRASFEMAILSGDEEEILVREKLMRLLHLWVSVKIEFMKGDTERTSINICLS